MIIIGSDSCITACVAGSVLVQQQQQPATCVACSVLYPHVPAGAPYAAYYSLFNARPGQRWWPPEYDPPHLPPRLAGAEADEPRAGVCWPCPIGTPFPSPDSMDEEPCSQADLESNTMMTLAQPQAMAQNRRLLMMPEAAPPSSSWTATMTCPPGQLFLGYFYDKHTASQAMRCVPCSRRNYYCVDGKEYPCPPFQVSDGHSPSECKCAPGWTAAKREGGLQACVPSSAAACPKGYRISNGLALTPLCEPCPPNTFSAGGSEGVCHQCPFQVQVGAAIIISQCMQKSGSMMMMIRMQMPCPDDLIINEYTAWRPGDGMCACSVGSELTEYPPSTQATPTTLTGMVSLMTLYINQNSSNEVVGDQNTTTTTTKKTKICSPCAPGKVSSSIGFAPCRPY